MAAEALELDRQTGQPLWENYLKNIRARQKSHTRKLKVVSLKKLGKVRLMNSKDFNRTCHIIFGVKMDFTRKERYVANGSITDILVDLCYSSIVSCDSTRIALLLAALNDLDILACDIFNAYINDPFRERIYFFAGMECGKSLEGKVMRLVRALYGLKRSGASWRNMFKDHIANFLELTPSTVEPDMYYQCNTNEDGTNYYELLLV